MVELFNKNSVIKTLSGKVIKVKEALKDGVFSIDYEGKNRTLNVYYGECPEEVKNMLGAEKPYGGMLWPEDLLIQNNSYGIVLELPPEGYLTINHFASRSGQEFSSADAVAEACLQIVSAFGILKSKGLCFHCVSDDSFYIDPENGDVILGNPLSVGKIGNSPVVKGVPRYMAPELLREECPPDDKTDLHTLGVVLFMLMLSAHPLEGKRCFARRVWGDIIETLYASTPLFIFDSANKDNEAQSEYQKYSLEKWLELDDDIKNAFASTFSGVALMKRKNRTSIYRWSELMANFKSRIVTCSCEERIFCEEGVFTCKSCGLSKNSANRMEFSGTFVPVYKGVRVFKCQIVKCGENDALDPVFFVVSKNDDYNVLGVVNMTEQTLNAVTPSGISKKVVPGDVIPYISGISVEVYGSQIKFK